jgi:hypothetical protein
VLPRSGYRPTDPGFQPWVSWFTRRALKASSTPRSRGAIRGGRASPRAARTFPTQSCISRPRLQDVLGSADKRIARTRSLPDPPRCRASRVIPDVSVRCRITAQRLISSWAPFSRASSDIPNQGLKPCAHLQPHRASVRDWLPGFAYRDRRL